MKSAGTILSDKIEAVLAILTALLVLSVADASRAADCKFKEAVIVYIQAV